MQQARVGVLGLGTMGSKYAMWLGDGEVEGLHLAAVANRGKARRIWAGQRLGQQVQCFDSAEALLQSGTCDAVVIATPHEAHCVQALAAFRQGLHVLCDKPAAVHLADARRMAHAARESGKVYGIIYNQRTDPVYRALHALVQSGTMGALKRVNWIITDFYRPDAYYTGQAWRSCWAGQGGGLILNQCLHQLDILQWLCGMPQSLQAFCQEGKWHDIEVEDDATVYMEFAGGATGVFVASSGDAPGTNRLELTFDGGKVVCENGGATVYRLAVPEPEYRRTATDVFAKPEHRQMPLPLEGEYTRYHGVLAAFAGAVLHGGPLVADGAEGTRAVELANAIYLSSWLGAPVRLPLDEALYLQKLRQKQGG